MIGSPSAPSSSSSYRWAQLVAGLAAAALCTLTIGIASASASKQVIAYFGTDAEIGKGTLGGEFGRVSDVAVNSSGAGSADAGDIYVLESFRLQRFSQDDNGTPADPYDDTFPFVSAWGAGVDASQAGSAYEICTVAANCTAGEAGGANGALGSLPEGIAVDQDTGFVYVTDSNNQRVSVYEGDGSFIRSFGWDVVQSGPGDAGTGYEICVAANGDTCKTGVGGNGPGQLGNQASACGIAISPADGNPVTGTIYVADGRNARVNTYNLDGSAPSSFGSATNFDRESGAAPEHVAVDSRGIVYITDRENDSEIERYDSLNVNGNGVGFLAPIAARTIRVSGGPGNGLGSTPYQVTFTGPLGESNVSQLTVSDGTTPLSGGAGASVTTTTPGGPGADEVQKVTLAATAGQFRLTFDGQTTGDLAFDAGRGQIRNALEDLSSVPPAPLPTDNIQRMGLEVDPDSDGPGPDQDVLYSIRDGASGTTVVQQFGPVNAPGLTVPPATQDDAHGAVAGFNYVRGLGLDTASGRLFVGIGAFYGIGGPSDGAGDRKAGVYVLDEATNTPPTVSLDSVDGVTATSATVHATVNPNGGPQVTYRVEYSLGGTIWTPTPEVVIGTQESPQSIDTVLSPPPVGLEPASSYQVRLRVTKAFTQPLTTSPLSFTTLVAAPVVETTGAPLRTTRSARLDGRVSPRSTATAYFFEYGTQGPCDANPCTQTAAQQAGSGAVTQLVSEEITGLEPNTTYHYRILADNGLPGSPVAGEDRTTTTLASEAPLSHGRFPGPPGSDRAYEQISPPDTGGNPVTEPLKLSADGDRAIYQIAGGTPESESGNLFSVFYAERTPTRWEPKLILPPRNESSGPPRWKIFADPEISTAIAGNLNETTLESEIWRLNPQGSPTQLFEGPVSAYGVGELAISDDGSRLVTILGGPQDPAHPTPLSTVNFYDVTSGSPHLLNFLPDGSVPACGMLGTTLPDRPSTFGWPDRHFVSADGTMAFFSNNPCSEGRARVYVRDINVGQTHLISRPPVTGLECSSSFISSTPEAAFFWSKSRLVGEDSAPSTCAGNDFDGDVYRYDLVSEELMCVTCVLPGADVDVIAPSASGKFDPGAIHVAEDGSRVYFDSSKALLPGAPVSQKRNVGSTYRVEVNTGDLALVGGPNLFRQGHESVVMTPDGSVLLFQAKGSFLNPLNGSDNGGALQYYRYNDRDRSLVCLSCPTDGSSAIGGISETASLNISTTDDGSNLVFATTTPLVAADQNTPGVNGNPESGRDVYEWRDGRYFLVTDGLNNTTPDTIGPEAFGISADGRDLFFVAPAQYTPDALDGYRRLYDARIGGGFEYPKPSPPCALEVCQGIPRGVPEEAAPGTGAFSGPGNVRRPAARAKKCAKGKARRKGRCVAKKRPHVKKDRANHNRRTAR